MNVSNQTDAMLNQQRLRDYDMEKRNFSGIARQIPLLDTICNSALFLIILLSSVYGLYFPDIAFK